MSLRRVALRDFVIVPMLELELHDGFTVLTGETGAGKSILIDALQLLLGGRADSLVVRDGASRCEVSAEFDLPERLRDWLDEQGFAGDDTLLLRRTIDAEGRSRAWVNGSAATVAQLKQLGASLVDIHGQHAWQSLTRADALRQLLDGFGGIDDRAVRQAHGAWRDAHQRLQQARERQHSLQQDRDRLAWQLAEIDKLAPRDQEWAELNQTHQRLAHAQSLIDGAQGAASALEDEEPSASALIHRAITAIEDLVPIDPRFAEPLQNLHSAQALVQDAVHTLHQLGRHTELDPDTLAQLDERLGLWLSLARRYRCLPEDLPGLHRQWQADLKALDESQDIEALAQQEQAALGRLEQAARDLTQRRQRAAPKLSQAVTAALQQLGMAGGRLEVSLKPLTTIAASGAEEVEFLVAGHAGASPRPVGKVASGGELSRIALAISVVTSGLGEAGTLIFDEVDAGVGGAVAHTVGTLLRQLGAERQVLAVTHLAQVAACGHHHLQVGKHLVDGQTVSEVRALGGDARVAELARMLDGNTESELSIAHARELLSP